MHALWWNALLVTAASLAVWGWVLKRTPGPLSRPTSLWALALSVPLYPLVFFGLRLPLDQWLRPQLSLAFYAVARLCYAPVLEELAKLVPLAHPGLRRELRHNNLSRISLAIGIGFAIGEAWTLAFLLQARPELRQVPVWGFHGYLLERWLFCLIHAGLVSLSLLGWNRWALLPGLLTAMGCHALVKAPVWMMGWGAQLLGVSGWQVVQALWLYIVCPLVCARWLAHLSVGKGDLGLLLFGRVRCPGCQQVYEAPLWGFPLGARRLERCPHCRNWHAIGIEQRLANEM